MNFEVRERSKNRPKQQLQTAITKAEEAKSKVSFQLHYLFPGYKTLRATLSKVKGLA